MSFLRYESYRDSGVTWLGMVPNSWDVSRIRHLFEIKKRISGTDGYEVLSITQQGIKAKDIESGDGQLSADYSKYQVVEVGDFAMNHMDLLTGYVDISPKFGVTSPDYRVFSVRNKDVCFDKYFLYLFQAGYRNKIFYAFGQGSSQLGRWRFPTDEFNNFEFPLPPFGEQRAVVSFLDHEIAKIDALAAEQHRLTQLLSEKRQSVISALLTKGRNDAVPMKDSGIRWLGQVPAHWEVRKLSSLSTKITNGYVGPTRDILVEEGVRYLQSLHIKRNRIKFDEPYYVTETWSQEHKKSILEKGDVLIVQTGDIGQVAVVPERFVGCNCHALIIVAPVRHVVSGEWLAWTLNADYGKHSLLSIQTGALHPHLNCGNVKDLYVPLPPLAEQNEIVAACEETTEKLDGLIAEAQAAITLLHERRTALIYAAVTGKIDVRGLAESRLEEVAAE